MIERHYGALLDGAGAGIAGRLDALDAAQGEQAHGEDPKTFGPLSGQGGTTRSRK